MKINSTIYGGLLTGVLLLLIFSCKKDKIIDSRDSFTASYIVSEAWLENNIQQNKPAFKMSVEKSNQNFFKVLLINFANYGFGVYAEGTVTGNTITIPNQTLPNLKEISGSGTLTNDSLTITYTEKVGSTSFDITLSAKKL